MKTCLGGMDGPGGSGQFDLGPGCRSEEGERGTGIRKLNFLNSFGTFSEHEQHDIRCSFLGQNKIFEFGGTIEMRNEKMKLKTYICPAET